MTLMDKVRAKALANPCKVAFPEAEDEKMLKAMDEVSKGNYGKIVVVGNPLEIKKMCLDMQIDDSKWEYVDIADEKYKEEILKKYLQLPNLVYGEKSLRRRLNDSLYLALMMEAVKEVDLGA